MRLKFFSIKGPLAVGMRRVFGTNKWAWMLPIAPKLDVNALELLYYHVEVSGDKKGESKFFDWSGFVN